MRIRRRILSCARCLSPCARWFALPFSRSSRFYIYACFASPPLLLLVSPRCLRSSPFLSTPPHSPLPRSARTSPVDASARLLQPNPCMDDAPRGAEDLFLSRARSISFSLIRERGKETQKPMKHWRQARTPPSPSDDANRTRGENATTRSNDQHPRRRAPHLSPRLLSLLPHTFIVQSFECPPSSVQNCCEICMKCESETQAKQSESELIMRVEGGGSHHTRGRRGSLNGASSRSL